MYLPLPAADADDFVAFARAIGLKGASVTIPFKVPLFEHVEEADDLTRRVGAINTLRIDGGRWTATQHRRRRLPAAARTSAVSPLAGRRAAILGAGGSARARRGGARVAGCRASRSTPAIERRPRRVAALVVGQRRDRGRRRPARWDLLVNCTPVGMHPNVDETPVPAADLSTGRVVYDLIYNPPATRLLRDAAAAGCETIGGLDMLVAQAQEQFEWWTGTRPSADVMRAAALEAAFGVQHR